MGVFENLKNLTSICSVSLEKEIISGIASSQSIDITYFVDLN